MLSERNIKHDTQPADRFSLQVNQSVQLLHWYPAIEHIDCYHDMSLAMKADARLFVAWCYEHLWIVHGFHIVYQRAYRFMYRLESSPVELYKIKKKLHQLLADIVFDNQYALGRSFTIADAALASIVSTLDYLGQIEWKSLHELYTWYLKVKCRPSLRNILLERVSKIEPCTFYSKLDWNQDSLP